MSLTQPLIADERSNISAPPPGLERAAILPETQDGLAVETNKQRVRRLAAHCQKYRGADLRLAALQMASTLIPLAIIVAAMFATVRNAYWATLLLAIPAAGLLVRVFIIQHDCGHGSFLKSRQLNDVLGRCMSVLTMAPYGLWRREHAQHHAASGNLDRRGAGDIDTLTVAEYQTLSTLGKFRYRLYRHPLFLFGFGVPAYFMLVQRTPWLHALSVKESWKSVLGLNLALVAFYGPLIYVFGVSDVFWVVLPIVHVASAVGGWLFFIQHQFEETTWDQAEGWDFQVAALLGSSFYDLPKALNWFTGNIGLHHIHHLNSMIPNYRLQDCLDASPELRAINRLTLGESFACAKLKLWDDKARRMIRFDELPRAVAA
ncbi:MAG: fatty acid desaturase [Hyphomicrobium sp.]